jgi:hypothetical protein
MLAHRGADSFSGEKASGMNPAISRLNLKE